MSDLFRLIDQAEAHPGPWILVSLVRTEGSTYRKKGAHMLVSPSEHLGMISGGCLEADVAARCRSLFSSSQRALKLEIDTRRLLGCDGRLTLLAERLPVTLLEQFRRLQSERARSVLSVFPPGPRWRKATLEREPLPGAYCQEVDPPLRLLIFGATPGATPLKNMAGLLGWECDHLILPSDPQGRRADQETALADLRALAQWRVDERTACVVMNHNVGRDVEVLTALWNTPTPFLGLLGGRKRRDEILERLAFGPGDLDLDARHLYAPVGLDLGAEGAAEIALEVCAEVQKVFARCKRGMPAATGAR